MVGDAVMALHAISEANGDILMPPSKDGQCRGGSEREAADRRLRVGMEGRIWNSNR